MFGIALLVVFFALVLFYLKPVLFPNEKPVSFYYPYGGHPSYLEVFLKTFYRSFCFNFEDNDINRYYVDQILIFLYYL